MAGKYRYKGRHRKVTHTTRNVLAVGTMTAIGSATLVGTANAASDNTWDKLAQCESGGNWSINTGNGYYGGLQFSPRTWDGFKKGLSAADDAHQAPRATQIAVAERVLAAQGWNAWPACSKKLGIRGEPSTARKSSPSESKRESVRPRRSANPAPNRDASARSHRVVSGDTLSEIAQKYNVKGGWRALAAKNGIKNANRIYVGDVLQLS